MSRLRRLKERKRKNMIKATSCGLALALVMGSAQGLGTYALFTDTENIASDLAISTGDVDVEINPGIDFTDIKPGEEKEIPVTISNKGTLNQNIKLDISKSDKISEYINYGYEFDGITVIDGVMYKDENLFVLAPGTSISGKLKITLDSNMSTEIQNGLAGTKYDVNLTVKSTQISDNSKEVFNDGFYDEVTQGNTITIAQKEIITIVNGGIASFTNGGSNKYERLYIPVNIDVPNGYTFELSAEVTAKDKFGNIAKGEYSAEQSKFNGRDYILIKPTQNTVELLFGGTFNITINVIVKKGSSIEHTYKLECNTTLANAGNNCDNPDHPNHDGAGNGGKCKNTVVNTGLLRIIDILENVEVPTESEGIESPKEEIEIPSEPEVVEPPKEEVEKPSEPDVVEPPKEEIEVPSEPEVVEPPKEEVEIPTELEVVEPPKEEIIEIPKQPEAIEPPKENEGIQE